MIIVPQMIRVHACDDARQRCNEQQVNEEIEYVEHEAVRFPASNHRDLL